MLVPDYERLARDEVRIVALIEMVAMLPEDRYDAKASLHQLQEIHHQELVQLSPVEAQALRLAVAALRQAEQDSVQPA